MALLHERAKTSVKVLGIYENIELFWKRSLQHYRNGDLGSTLKPSAAKQAPVVVKILHYTDVSHARPKTLLQDVTDIKHVCQNFVSRLVPHEGKNPLASPEMGFRKTTTTWSVL